MPDLKPITIVATSVEAGQGGHGTVMVRFTNPFADGDFHIRVPVNLNSPNFLKYYENTGNLGEKYISSPTWLISAPRHLKRIRRA